MTSARDIADTTPARSQLRLIVLAQWIRLGLDLAWGRAKTRDLVGGAVALWRLAQAVRLAIALARRLADSAGAPRAAAPATGARPWPGPVREGPVANAAYLEAAYLEGAFLEGALAELAAAISHALGGARRRRPSPWRREPSALRARRASPNARGPRRRRRRRTRALDRRPLRPPGPDRPCRRSRRTPGAPRTVSTPIAILAVGRDPLAWAHRL